MISTQSSINVSGSNQSKCIIHSNTSYNTIAIKENLIKKEKKNS